MYRETQLLTLELNNCYQLDGVPISVTGACLVEITSLYVCIAQWKSLPPEGLLFFLLAAADAFILRFGMLKLASKVFIESQEVRRSLKKILAPHPRFRRFWRSCSIHKVSFGGSNFIDECTPLVMNQFSLNQTISMVLVER